jgi:hypothetical protein
MSLIPGTNVAALIAPFDTSDTFPSHDSQYGLGGWREVANYAALSAIPAPRLRAGMIATAQDTLQPWLYNGSAWVPLAAQLATYCVTWGVGIGAPVATGTNVTPLYVVPLAGVPANLTLAAKTAPTGADLVIDILRNGTTILAAPVSLAAGATSASSTNFAPGALNAGDVLTLDVNQIGSTFAGQDVTIQLQIS